MMKTLLFWSLACGVLLIAATSRSDVSTPTIAQQPSTMSEPITDTASVPNGGTTEPPRDPFTPYATGSGVWAYEKLKPAERAVADRGRDVTGWDQTNDAFATAAHELASQAAGGAAGNQLGVDNLAATGVVP